MAYNHIYNLQFKGLDQVETDLYYQVKFEKYDDTVIDYDIIELTPAQDSPFVLNYKATEDNIFSPIRSSFADIKCFIPYNSTIQPYDFYYETDEFTLRVSLYETNGVTETLKWRGFLLPDVIQYEWQEQYYLQLTATDNLAVLKDIKYTKENFYSLYLDTSVTDGISVKDYICKLLSKTNSELDVAIFSKFNISGNLYQLEDLKMSDYTGVDWSTFEPKDCYFLLTSLMHSLGCMLYQSNANATWYIISINDVAVADLITDGSFSIDGSIFGQPYEYWTITGDVINSETGGINGSQCPRIRGDNTANVLQTISISNIDYIVGFWAQNDNNISPPAFVRVEINGTEVYSTAIANGFNYYEFEYPSSISGSYDLQFFNNNDDSAGYMSLDNVTFKAKYIDGKLYDIDAVFIDDTTYYVYSSIGNQGSVIWSDVNQVVTLNRRLTNVQFKYPYYERNLVDNFGFWKGFAPISGIPFDWDNQGGLVTSNVTNATNVPFDAGAIDILQEEINTGALNLDDYLYTNMNLSNFTSDYPNLTAVKIECAVKFSATHQDNDGINIAFIKTQAGNPSVFGSRYLNWTGVWATEPASPFFDAPSRIPIFMDEQNKWMKFKCYSKFDTKNVTGVSGSQTGTLVIRPQRSVALNAGNSVMMDNFKVSVIPQAYQYTKGFIYNATNVSNTTSYTKPFINVYKLDKCQFHGGISGDYQSQIIEDFIGYIPPEGVYIESSDNWSRTWESSENSRPLEEIITKSILSFYQATWQKFTGNVYGKEINFGQVFTIALAQGLHFMHEASFDYVSNKTNITTHQSQTDRLESGFRSWAVTEDDMSAGQGEPGSTTSNIQDVESLITPGE
mgnify:FL=1|jgi:hypothetical protein